jgi:putative sigma-54 modulation protein
MQLTITGHHIELSPALRDYVEAKLKKLERHFDNMTDIHCVLTVEKLTHKAEATVHLSGGTIHAESLHEEHKEKLTDHHAREVEKPRF